MKTKRVWFPADTMPVNIGVYLVRKPGGALYWRHYDGTRWLNGEHADCKSPARANARLRTTAFIQNVEWCGLVDDGVAA